MNTQELLLLTALGAVINLKRMPGASAETLILIETAGAVIKPMYENLKTRYEEEYATSENKPAMLSLLDAGGVQAARGENFSDFDSVNTILNFLETLNDNAEDGFLCMIHTAVSEMHDNYHKTKSTHKSTNQKA